MRVLPCFDISPLLRSRPRADSSAQPKKNNKFNLFKFYNGLEFIYSKSCGKIVKPVQKTVGQRSAEVLVTFVEADSAAELTYDRFEEA